MDRARQHWSIEAHHHIRDTTFSEDTAASRTGSGPANLATIRATVIAAIKDEGYLHVPEGRRDHTPPRPSASTASIKDRCGHSRNTHDRALLRYWPTLERAGSSERKHCWRQSGYGQPSQAVT